jgi:peptide methionine sulfoxide reductase msrA/msrB
MDFIDKIASLTPKSKDVICDKATELPHTGEYNQVVRDGTYLCRRCGLALFRGTSQFASHCGWPSFDAELAGAVQEIPDQDGMRMEIVCARCNGHLGHVFRGEHFTQNNIRHCVNSASIDFVPDSDVLDSAEVIVAGGCFWGVDYYLRRLPGVLKVEAGYCGGKTSYPTYYAVCQGDTGHFEAVRVLFDRNKTDSYTVFKRFFEIHDPTQSSGQGPDIGSQYQSAVFYYDEQQQEEAEDLIHQLKGKGYEVVTQLLPVSTFWPAEEAHQDYYEKHNKIPYCHKPVLRF